MNKSQKQLALHIGLFFVTFATTTLAGAEWMYSKMLFWVDEGSQMTWGDFKGGLNFSIPFLLILTSHEFGHYFTAKYHKIRVTLPYYIPFWLGFVLAPSFGTMGAMIRIKGHIHRLKHYFDIGISGPLAGFIVAFGAIWFGFAHLPEPEYIFQIHPEYEKFGPDYADHVYESGDMVTFKFGDSLLFRIMQSYIADPERIPHPNEIIHYPCLLAGYLALFFTALNLLPIGQLDGGHILFGMVGGKWHSRISMSVFSAFLFYAGLGLTSMADLQDISLGSCIEFLLTMAVHIYVLYIASFSMFEKKQNRLLFAVILFVAQFAAHYLFDISGYFGWMLFGIVLGRFLGVKHPPVIDKGPLSAGRKVLGWIALAIFILCFSPKPFILEIAR